MTTYLFIHQCIWIQNNYCSWPVKDYSLSYNVFEKLTNSQMDKIVDIITMT